MLINMEPTTPSAAEPHRATPPRRLPAPLPALVLALALLSCTGEDLQVPPPDSAIQWQAYAETYCQALAACCGPETRIFNDFSCVDNYLRRVVYTAYEYLPLNPWRLQRCLQKRSAQLALGCDTEMSLLFKDCLNMVDRPDSRADCGHDRDCAIDAYCQPDGCAGGICAPRLRESQACEGYGGVNRQCRDGLVCRYLSGTAGDFACQHPQEVMQDCFSHTDCGSHYDRHVACIGGRCAARLETGQRCAPLDPLQCLSGFCDPDTSLCAPLTFRRYCENVNTLQWVFDADFDHTFSRY